MCLDNKHFQAFFTSFLSDRNSSTKSRGSGVLIAVFSRVLAFKRKYELRVLLRMRLDRNFQPSGHSLLTGNHYSTPPPTRVIPN
jgi:hypothetical protein